MSYLNVLLDDISNPGLNLTPLYPYITMSYLLLRFVFQSYLGTCACTVLFCAHALFIYLIDVYI